MACPQLGVILAYWKQTGVSSPKNPIALAVGVSIGIPWRLKKSHKGEKILEDEVSKDLFTGLLFIW